MNVTLTIKDENLLEINPVTFNVTENERDFHWNISVIGLSPGYSVISANVTPNITEYVQLIFF